MQTDQPIFLKTPSAKKVHNSILSMSANFYNQKLGLLSWKIRNIRPKIGTKN